MTSGRSPASPAANHSPSARACSAPSLDKGTSTSRWSSFIRSAPAASAASRATLPALCPCRTTQSVEGQRGETEFSAMRVQRGTTKAVASAAPDARVARRSRCLTKITKSSGLLHLLHGSHGPAFEGGLQHDLGVEILLVVPVLVHLCSVLERCVVRDQRDRVKLAFPDHP